MTDNRNPFDRTDFKGERIAEYSGINEEEADRLVLEELRSRGSDLSLVRHIVHHLWFDAMAERDSAAIAIEQQGYNVDLPLRDNSSEAYLLRAERTGIADEVTIKEDRLLLSEISTAHGGWYDGWAASEDDSTTNLPQESV